MSKPKGHFGRVGWAIRYDLVRPGMRLIHDAGRELRWHGITIGQWGIGFIHSVKVRPGVYESDEEEEDQDA